MALGQPKLVTWRSVDKTLRLYEYSTTSGFVQVATGSTQASGTSETNNQPFFEFVDDSAYLFVVSNLDYGSASSFRYRSVRRLLSGTSLAQMASLSITNYSPTVVPAFGPQVSRMIPFVLTPDTDARAQSIEGVIFRNGQLFNAGGTDADITGLKMAAMQPYDESVFLATSASNALYPRSGYEIVDGVEAPVFNGAPIIMRAISGEVIDAEWSSSGKYLFILTKTGLLYVYNKDGEYLYIKELSYNGMAVKASPNGRLLAVSEFTGTTYITTVYTMSGNTLVPLVVFNDMGRLLTWTIDSTMLIDAGMKKLKVFDLTTDAVTDRSNHMTNVVAGVEKQAVNQNSPITDLNFHHVYTEGGKAIANGTLDLANLKLALFDNKLRFNADLLTIDDLAPFEVISTGWAKGGRNVKNARYSETGNRIRLIADDFHGVFVDDVTFRTMVVYDATNKIPLLWVSAPKDISGPKFKQIRIPFSSGLITFS